LTRFIEKPWVDAELQRIVVAILTSQGGRIAGKFAAEANAQRELDRLEQESPGITEVDRNPDGSISIDMDWTSGAD